MIAYEDFAQDFNSGDIKKLHFLYDAREYMIAREEDEEGPTFVFASEEHEAVKFPSAKALLKYAIIAGHSLREIWYHITPICNDTLVDDDYVLTQYSDSLGQVLCSESGTATWYDHYLMRRLVPSVTAWLAVFLVILFCTLFVNGLTWTFFAVACAVSVGSLGVLLLILFSNTKRYRYGNPSAQLYLLDNGAVIITNRVEYAIPYTKILHLNTKAGIGIVTIRTVFTFVANEGAEITAKIKSIVEELKAERLAKKQEKKQRHKLQEKAQEQTAESPQEKSEEKPDEKPQETAEEKSEEKQDAPSKEEAEEHSKESTEEQSEEKPEESTEEPSEEKSDENSETQSEEKPDEDSEEQSEENSESEPEQQDGSDETPEEDGQD